MAKSAPEAERVDTPALDPGGYLHWSRDAAVGMFAVLPLWLAYEVLRWLVPEQRNGAEDLLLRELARLGGHAHTVASVLFAALVVAAACSIAQRKVPWLRVSAVIALEGTIYALMLGPLSSALVVSAHRFLAIGGADSVLAANLVGSLGAGIFEELVFRLGLMSMLVWIGLHAVRAWALPRALAGVFAVVVSALVFSWFHHLCGQPFERGVFLYRVMAGVLLGLLMWARGFGVCVYTHTLYDVYYYLSGHES